MSFDLAQFVFSGLTAGAIYALVALGFGIVHNTMGIVNFTQVDFVTLGGMALYSASRVEGMGMAGSLAAAILLSAAAGVVVERVGLRPARSVDHVVLIFITIGLSMALRGIIKIVWGKNRLAVEPLTDDEPIRLLGATILPQAVWIMALTSAAIVLLVLFFRFTSMGLAMRAVASNEKAARLIGLRVFRVRGAAFALAGAIGGLAGALITPITTVSADVGVLLGLKGFAAAVLGGFGSFPGAIVGGVTLGLLESLGAAYVSSMYKDAMAFIVLLAVLFIRPQGLLPRRESGRGA
jgi:branched-chain amino acid transport system permease protein